MGWLSYRFCTSSGMGTPNIAVSIPIQMKRLRHESELLFLTHNSYKIAEGVLVMQNERMHKAVLSKCCNRRRNGSYWGNRGRIASSCTPTRGVQARSSEQAKRTGVSMIAAAMKFVTETCHFYFYGQNYVGQITGGSKQQHPSVHRWHKWLQKNVTRKPSYMRK